MVNSKLKSPKRSLQTKNTLVKSSLTIEEQKSWTIEDSEELYSIKGWGEPYFSINAAGNVTVSPQGTSRGSSLDLYELIEALKQRQIQLPILIRFPDILADRLERLSACMDRAIARYKYGGKYQGVFPIKCNQNRHLVEALVQRGKPYQFGLEAGSKPELIIALAILEPNLSDSHPLLMCNGYKDREYIETALLATKLGQKPIIVIEHLSELHLALEISQQLAIKPTLGVRAKLDTKGTGRWGNSTGDRAKFGLTVSQILQMVQKLAAVDLLDCLQLLHFHIGSQISAIGTIKEAIKEASQIYVQLAKSGANMQYLNVGGGLAVDFDGSKRNSPASKNYNMQNYANDIVAQVQDACEQGQVAAPTLVSESGSAISAHQSILIFNILSSSDVSSTTVEPPVDEEHPMIHDFWETYQSIDRHNYQESYHDAVQFKQEALSLFNFGYLSLTERARTEELYWACCHKITALMGQLDYPPEELAELEQVMASIYYANLSIFQSAPDSWAIERLFPIMPIHRLDEQPTARATIADLTCDSDGKIDRFIDLQGSKHILELHQLQTDASGMITQPYYLGMFLVGAYQEVMGSLHNLFGDTNVVHIQTSPKGYQIESVVQGDTIAEVLNYVGYDAQDLSEIMRRRTEIALQEERITLAEARKLLQNYNSSLSNYTYLVEN